MRKFDVVQSRRNFMKFLGYGGLGLGGALWGCDASTSKLLNLNPSTISIQEFSFSTLQVDERGKVVERIDKNANYFTEDLGNGITLDMVIIPGGTFTMGAPSSEEESQDNERPQHEVTVSAFAMGRYQVTQAQWREVFGKNPSHFKAGDRSPVENVTWNESVEFCRKLFQQTGRDYRLPSEAEWEYACRAGTTTPFYFGETITGDLANNRGNVPYAKATKEVFREKTTEVGLFPPNAFGLYDMHGNVWEYCLDFWHDNYDSAPANGSAWVEDGDSKKRIVRGGSWSNDPERSRSASRYWNSPGFRFSIFGFRVVCPVPRTS